MRGEEDLVARLGEAPEEPAKIPVRVRSQKQLRLLDREDDARDLGRAGLEPTDEGDAGGRRTRERRAGSRRERPLRTGEPAVIATRSPPRRAVGKWTIGGVSPRSSSETDATVGKRRLDRERALARGDVGRRKVEARVEQGAEGEEQVGLSRPRLADERTDRAWSKRQPACATEIDDANLAEQRTGRCPGGGARRRAGLGLFRARRHQGRVTAPSLAVETSAAYFASTPLS